MSAISKFLAGVVAFVVALVLVIAGLASPAKAVAGVTGNLTKVAGEACLAYSVNNSTSGDEFVVVRVDGNDVARYRVAAGVNIGPNPVFDAPSKGLATLWWGDSKLASLEYDCIVTPPADTDGDGVNDDKDKCADTPAGTPVDDNGCPIVTPPVAPEVGYWSPSCQVRNIWVVVYTTQPGDIGYTTPKGEDVTVFYGAEGENEFSLDPAMEPNTSATWVVWVVVEEWVFEYKIEVALGSCGDPNPDDGWKPPSDDNTVTPPSDDGKEEVTPISTKPIKTTGGAVVNTGDDPVFPWPALFVGAALVGLAVWPRRKTQPIA
jgi:hypothetical protein